MAREVRLWEWLRDGLRGTDGLHMRRVENLVSEGDPDVDGCWHGRYFELELKGVVPAQDLYWSPRPAGWWIPERYRDRVQALTRDYFGYVQVLHSDGRREHDFQEPEVAS